jgi:hypothetical protein
MINYTDEQINEATRKELFPYKFASYITTPESGLVLPAGVRTKISLDITPSEGVNGFDIFVTPQGNALRFIGSGLGNGDTMLLNPGSMASLLSATGFSDSVVLGACTRPYTEPLFTNAVDIPGFSIERKQPNNDVGAIALDAPYFRVNDGDLIEICATSLTTITININKFAFKGIEI